ncbi:hypothetical protein FRX31_028964 [Thalictrum thalictroides]|uniref:Uncharacterized protein n=1 Tax=Thalictrum thalictroides TaxID=46969 RepID=A0A7J6VA36_THATH|nr:hypothetical protein FRX31_028964 [Thalictrum thalictroides]
MKGKKKIVVAKAEREFSAIDVDDGSCSLADSIQLSIPPDPSTLCSIYRVPDNLKKGYEDKYEPSIVSIGPYHLNKQNLKITERHKLWYMRDFISRYTPPQTSLKDIVKAVKNLEEKARACYAEEIDLSSDDFVRMMVIDGCFILELFYRNRKTRRKEDLIYSAPWVIETVKQDLVLLENQLPFIILVCLYQLSVKQEKRNKPYSDKKGEEEPVISLEGLNDMVFKNPSVSHPNKKGEEEPAVISLNGLNDMVFDFFDMGNNMMMMTKYSSDIVFPFISPETVEGNHLLDFLRNSIIPHEFDPKAYRTSDFPYDSFPCAKDLQEMGVKFKASYDTLAFLDITFEEGYLTFNHFRKGIMYSLFPNWIALEQCNCHFKGYITSYTLLLGQLVNSKDDVKFLRKTGIIVGSEVEDEKFVKEISRLCQRLKPIEFHYGELFLRLGLYTQTGCNRQRANLHNWYVILKRDYFSSPWAFISFIAAVVLLLLTAIQTMYAIRSYSPKV